MSAYVSPRTGRVDERVDVLPVSMKFTHGRHKHGWRIHRILRSEALHCEWFDGPEYRVHATTKCHQELREGDYFGTAESLIAAGGVLCPRCHPCRCAYPCAPQCICSIKCGTCDPRACTRARERAA